MSVPDAAPCSCPLQPWCLPFEPTPPRILPSLGTADTHLSRPTCVEQDGLCCSYDALVSDDPSRNAQPSLTRPSSARHQARPLHSRASVLSWSQARLCVYKQVHCPFKSYAIRLETPWEMGPGDIRIFARFSPRAEPRAFSVFNAFLATPPHPDLPGFVPRTREKQLPLGPVTFPLVGPGPSLTADEIFLDPNCVI